MPDPRSHSLDCPGEGNAASAHGDTPVPATSGPGAANAGKNSVSIRQAEAILAGLPEHVMDELVEDLAEAVVAILLDRQSAETVECDDESSDLRQV
jgi:hypothetical protein